MRFSVVIPVYNRPEELKELLESLCQQSRKPDEVIIVEDGSTEPSEDLVLSFAGRLAVQYFYKRNEGQGWARNYGFQQATGDYFVVFDSDTIIPKDYFHRLEQHLLKAEAPDAHGGPDAAHPSFTALQKAMSYSMTSFLTTGGIRGKKRGIGTFLARSFNMGFSRKVWAATKGYREPRMGEDVELSRRIISKGFRLVLLEDCYVFHKRRIDLKGYFRQVFKFGQTRIMLKRKYGNPVRLVHCFPAFFVFACLVALGLLFPFSWLGATMDTLLAIYFFAIFFDAWQQEKSLRVGLLAMVTTLVQHWGYGLGFLREWLWPQAGREQR